MRRHQEIESGAKKETNRIVEEAKEKEKAQLLIMVELKQEKTRLEDTIYRLKRCVVFVAKNHVISFVYPCSANAVKEVALKETQELLKQERGEVATLKVIYLLFTKFFI